MTNYVKAQGLILVLLLVTATAVSAADLPVSMVVNGRTVAASPAARVRDGVTYAPLRAAAEALGASVEWDGKARRAVICDADSCTVVRAEQGIIVSGSLLIPLRAMGEALGAKVTWDARAATVYVTAQGSAIAAGSVKRP